MLQPYSDISLVGPSFFRHTNFRQYSNYIKPYLNEVAGTDTLETICLVREPLSWLNSQYRFRSRFDIRKPNHPRHSSSTQGITFPEYLEAYMSEDPPTFARVGTQFDFVKNDLNEIGVTTIFPYENISDFVRYMSTKLSKKLTINYRNVSPKKGGETKILALIHYANRKMSRALHLAQPIGSHNVEFNVADDLVNSLRKFIPRDFALYEDCTRSQPVA